MNGLKNHNGSIGFEVVQIWLKKSEDGDSGMMG